MVPELGTTVTLDKWLRRKEKEWIEGSSGEKRDAAAQHQLMMCGFSEEKKKYMYLVYDTFMSSTCSVHVM